MSVQDPMTTTSWRRGNEKMTPGFCLGQHGLEEGILAKPGYRGATSKT